jgi:crossover junction endodeoxyribonuclease RuvC
MAALVLGIDPGVLGALVLLDRYGESYVTHLEMPIIKVGTTRRVNGAPIAALLRDFPSISHAYVEKVGAMPGQGVASMFNFGHAAGLVEGVVTGAGIPLTLVTPNAWKKAAGLIGKDKDAARSRAIQLYPGLRSLDIKARGQALADAILIARYGIGQLSKAA